MKKIIAVLTAALLTFTFAGCAEKETFPTNEEIMNNVTPYLENAEYQDPELYASFDEFLSANLGLSEKDVQDAVLYMGAPKQNTTFFLMLTKTADADNEKIMSKLESKMESQLKTASQGYITGYTEYSIIEKENKVFVIMHENSEDFKKLQEYINSL